MRVVVVGAAILCTLTATSHALELVKRDESPAVVGLPIQRRSVQDFAWRDAVRLRKRQGQTVTQGLDNFETSLYFANVSFGTPGQQVRLQIDTGSSDTWANSPVSPICQLSDQDAQNQGLLPCSVSGTYDANKSSSYKYVNSNFVISYLDGSGAQGDYITDVLGIGGANVKGLQLGVGYNSSAPEAKMGIGYGALEVQAQANGLQPYPNLPQAMADAGMIQSNAFSLWLNDLNSAEGSILFGGVDTGKYHGSLSTLPIQKVEDSFQEFIVALTGVSIIDGNSNTSVSTSELPAGVLLDTGSTLSYLPQNVATNIFKAFKVQYDDQAQTGYIDCNQASSSSSIEFSFSGASIQISMSELVLPGGTDAYGNPVTFNDGSPACSFGIAIGSGSGAQSTLTLGDTFLRSAFVVYDVANNQISLAQTNFNSTESNVMEIGKGQASVPDATGVASAATLQVTQTAGAHGGGHHGTGTITLAPGATQTKTGSANQIPMGMGAWAGMAGAGLMMAL